MSITTQFKKDYKRLKNQNKNIKALRAVIEKLSNKENLGAKYRVHRLSGRWKKHRECHIVSDWLLIYRVASNELVLERTGSHSELFK